MFDKKQFLIDFFDYTKNYNLDGYSELKSQMQKDTRILLEKYSNYLSE
jgi:hypothetical protein